MPARIWIINQFANTPDVPGHIRQYEIGQFLSNQEYEVEVFASDYNLTQRQYRKLKFGQGYSSENYHKLKWNWLYATPYKINNWQRYVNMLSFCITLFIVGLIKPKPNIIIGSSPQLLAAFTAWLLAKIHGAYFYFEVRDLWPQVLIELGGKSPKNLLVRGLAWIEKFLYKKSNHVIVLASGAVDYVKKRGAANVHWLPNGPNLKEFENNITPKQAKQKYNIPSDCTCLMYTGAHGTANALETIVEACRILDDEYSDKILVILLGDGPDKQDLIKQAKGIQCLEFRDPLPKQEIPKFLQAADGFILTLKNIPLFQYGVSPNKLYDYYASGKPVIVAVGGAVNAEVTTYQLGWAVPPENSKDLAQAMVSFLKTSQEEREAMGERGKNLVHSTYSRRAICQKLSTLIQEDINL
ncbi:glycosyltransferase family 4 protein [Spirulina subsalsa FACHB-351]|uniref:Glycosyltransferase family 4 protein n=1 Tax=Spirulina subsalsa FACHB-351 TaxID=234711 RepID=A0ABT3L924_9CYAN|nr:glycosyltransferase family 4 protein [Spirulina subsalsa]MCW6038011.1 glycosyltransferase family 4 protein [Spirulina subsalsa FACHB-351]